MNGPVNGPESSLEEAQARLSLAVADLRRWPAGLLADRQRLNDRLGASLEHLAGTLRGISEQVGRPARP